MYIVCTTAFCVTVSECDSSLICFAGQSEDGEEEREEEEEEEDGEEEMAVYT